MWVIQLISGHRPQEVRFSLLNLRKGSWSKTQVQVSDQEEGKGWCTLLSWGFELRLTGHQSCPCCWPTVCHRANYLPSLCLFLHLKCNHCKNYSDNVNCLFSTWNTVGTKCMWIPFLSLPVPPKHKFQKFSKPLTTWTQTHGQLWASLSQIPLSSEIPVFI